MPDNRAYDTFFPTLFAGYAMVASPEGSLVSWRYEFCRILFFPDSPRCHAGANVPRKAPTRMVVCNDYHGDVGSGRALRLLDRRLLF